MVKLHPTDNNISHTKDLISWNQSAIASTNASHIQAVTDDRYPYLFTQRLKYTCGPHETTSEIISFGEVDGQRSGLAVSRFIIYSDMGQKKLCVGLRAWVP